MPKQSVHPHAKITSSRQRAAWRKAQHPMVLCANGGIGDHLIAIPAVRALAKTFPGKLQLICRQNLGRCFFDDLPLRAIHENLKWGHEGMHGELNVTIKKVAQCDLFMMAETWHAPAIEQLLADYSPRHSIGYIPIFQHCLRQFKSYHRMDVLFEMPRTIVPTLEVEMFAHPPAHFVSTARRFRRLLPKGKKMLGVHPQTKGNKTWPLSHWEAFLKEFLSRHPDFVVFILGLEDFCQMIERLGSRVIPCPRLSLPDALSFVGALDFFVGVDSCMLHSADLFRIPGVGLFGMTNPAVWGFRLSRHQHIFGGGQMNVIQPESVLHALESLM